MKHNGKKWRAFALFASILAGSCNESSRDNYPNPSYCDDRTEEVTFYAVQPIVESDTPEENQVLSNKLFQLWEAGFLKYALDKSVKLRRADIGEIACKALIPSGNGKRPSIIFYTIYYNSNFTSRSLVRTKEHYILSANILWLSDINSSFCDENKIIDREALINRPFGVRYGVAKKVNYTSKYDETYWDRFLLENGHFSAYAYASACKRPAFWEQNPVNAHPRFSNR